MPCKDVVFTLLLLCVKSAGEESQYLQPDFHYLELTFIAYIFHFQFKPSTGPVKGGTNITITGVNLGKIFDDIKDGVSVADIPCMPFQKLYQPARRYGRLLSTMLSMHVFHWSLSILYCLTCAVTKLLTDKMYPKNTINFVNEYKMQQSNLYCKFQGPNSHE